MIYVGVLHRSPSSHHSSVLLVVPLHFALLVVWCGGGGYLSVLLANESVETKCNCIVLCFGLKLACVVATVKTQVLSLT